jgi:hypothetical protein
VCILLWKAPLRFYGDKSPNCSSRVGLRTLVPEISRHQEYAQPTSFWTLYAPPTHFFSVNPSGDKEKFQGGRVLDAPLDVCSQKKDVNKAMVEGVQKPVDEAFSKGGVRASVRIARVKWDK